MKRKKVYYLFALMTIFNICVYAQDFDSESDFRWERSGEGVIITRYVGTNTVIRIPPQIQGMSVVRIGKHAFDAFNFVIDWSRRLTSVTIPDSVIIIDDFAFQSNRLTSLVIPDNVTSIGTSAFGSNQISNLSIGNSVTSIGGTAFARNELTNVIIPDSVTSIGERAFAENQLISIIIPDSVTSIGERAFSYNQITNLIIGNSVTSIGREAFRNNQLTRISIPDSVITIGNSAFLGNKLTSVIIGNGVISIGREAFQGQNHKITRVIIPNNVTSIGEQAFGNAVLVRPDGSAYVASSQPQRQQTLSGQNQDKLMALLLNPMMAGSFGQFKQGERVNTTRALLSIIDSTNVNNTIYYLVRINEPMAQPFYITTSRRLNLLDTTRPNTIYEELILEFVGWENYMLNGVPRETFVFRVIQ